MLKHEQQNRKEDTDKNKDTSLLIAIKTAQPLSVLQSLLESGQAINPQDAEGNTPLHLAAAYPHLEYVTWLVEHGADTTMQNHAKQLPYEIAKAKGYKVIAHYLNPYSDHASEVFITTLEQNPVLKKQYLEGYIALRKNETKQAQTAFKQAYQLAEQQQDFLAQILCLEQLAKVYLQQNEYAAAAILANAALAYYDQHFKEKADSHPPEGLTPALPHKTEREHLLKICVQIEINFLQKYLQKRTITRDQALQRLVEQHTAFRKYLSKLREKIQWQLESTHYSAHEIMQYTTKLLLELIRQLLEDYCISTLGEPPCEYAFISLGSMSREEMSPYSDLEFAVLIAEETAENKFYFTQLVKLLQLKVINLGETNPDRDEVCILLQLPMKGFCFNSTNTPIANEALIATPQQLALWQKMQCTNYIIGSKTLFNQYEKLRETIFNNPPENSIFNVNTLYEHLGLQTIITELRWHESELEEIQETRFFNIKEELSHLLDNIIGGLTYYYHLVSRNTWHRLDELCTENIITTEVRNALKNAKSTLARWSIRAQLHYQAARDDIYHPNLLRDSYVGKEIIRNLFTLQENDLQFLLEMYAVVVPFYKAAKLFCEQHRQENPFKLITLDNSNAKALGEIYLQSRCITRDVARARDYYQQLYAYHSEQIDLLINLGKITDSKEETKYFEQALTFYESVCGQNHPLVAYCYSRLGRMYFKHKAIDYSLRALTIAETIYNKNHPNLITILHSLSRTYQRFSELQQALNYAKRALAIAESFYSKTHPDLVLCLHDVGHVLVEQGKLQEAIGYYERALHIAEAMYSKYHSLIPYRLEYLGVAWRDIDINYIWKNKNKCNSQKIIDYMEQAVYLTQRVLGKNHPIIATYTLGLADETIDVDPSKGINYYETALTIAENAYGKQHIEVAIFLRRLGGAWATRGGPLKAIEYLKHALAIVEHHYGKKHVEVAQCLYQLGIAHAELANKIREPRTEQFRAIDYYQRALEIYQSIYEQLHSNVLDCLIEIGKVWNSLEQPYEAISYFERALAIKNNLHDATHPAVTDAFFQLGKTWKTLKNYAKAAEYFELLLAIHEKIYGADHPKVARTLSEALAEVYLVKGEANKAIQCLERALIIIRQDKTNPEVTKCINEAQCLFNLGNAWETLGEGTKVINYFEQTLAIREQEKIYNWNIIAYEDYLQTLRTLGNLYFFGEAGIAHDYKKALQYYEKCNEYYKKKTGTDDPFCQYKIGLIYYWGGFGIQQACQKALFHFETAALQGDADSLCAIGIMHDNGDGVEQNYQKAHEYYEQAAAKGHVVAKYAVGSLYEKGKGINQDFSKALDYYSQVLKEREDESVNYRLGIMYEKGKGVKQDRRKAQEFYRKAYLTYLSIAQNCVPQDANACFKLGIMYEKGRGVAKDSAMAKQWFLEAFKATANNSPKLQAKLKKRTYLWQDSSLENSTADNPKNVKAAMPDSQFSVSSFSITENYRGMTREMLVQAYQAEEKNQYVLNQIRCLSMLAETYFQQENLIAAAKLANAAFALCRPFPSLKKEYESLSLFLAKLERTYMIMQGCREAMQPEFLWGLHTTQQRYRQILLDLRKQVKLDIDNPKISSEEILKRITETFRNLIIDMINTCISVLGKPPCKYTLASLGSMSREEMCPYSDVEFVFLIARDTEKNQAYFQHLSWLLELKIINLGETPCKIEGLYISPRLPLSGFCLDNGLGPVLIKSPEQLAELHHPSKAKATEKLLIRALTNVSYVTGSQTLFSRYQSCKTAFLACELDTAIYKTKIWRQQQALTMMQEELRWHEPQLDSKKEQQRFFNIKDELYRLPNNIINNLAVYYDLHSKNSWNRLDELYDKGILSTEVRDHLKKTMAFIVRLRVRTHLHYGTEREDVFHKSLLHNYKPNDKEIQNLFPLQNEDIQALFEIHKILLPLHKAVKLFGENFGDSRVFKNMTFNAENLLAQGKSWEQLNDDEKAEQCYQQAIALNPDDAETLRTRGRLLDKLNKYAEALIDFQKALDLDKTKYHEQHPNIGYDFALLGMVHVSLEDYEQAKLVLEQALTIEEHEYGQGNPYVTTLINLATAYGGLGNHQQKKVLLERALAVQERELRKNHPKAIHVLIKLGLTCLKLGDHTRAREVVEQALIIQESIYGQHHPDLVYSLRVLSVIYSALHDYTQQKTSLERALFIQENEYGRNHLEVAEILNSLGTVYGQLGDQRGRDLLLRALTIKEQIHGKNHPKLANTLHYLAYTMTVLNNLPAAIEYYERLLKLDPSNSSALQNLACCYHAQAIADQNPDLLQKADNNFQQALQVESHSGVCTEYANFLCKHNRFAESIPLLIQVITKLKQDERELGYSTVEKSTLPKTLSQEIDVHSGSIELKAFLFAYYLLVLSYKETQQPQQAQVIILEFQQAISKNPSPLYYSLLGYAYKELGYFKEAALCFGKAMQLKQDYALAKHNLTECQQLAATNSLQSSVMADKNSAPETHLSPGYFQHSLFKTEESSNTKESSAKQIENLDSIDTEIPPLVDSNEI